MSYRVACESAYWSEVVCTVTVVRLGWTGLENIGLDSDRVLRGLSWEPELTPTQLSVAERRELSMALHA